MQVKSRQRLNSKSQYSDIFIRHLFCYNQSRKETFLLRSCAAAGGKLHGERKLVLIHTVPLTLSDYQEQVISCGNTSSGGIYAHYATRKVRPLNANASLQLGMCRIDFLTSVRFKKTWTRFRMSLVQKNSVPFGYYSYLLLM